MFILIFEIILVSGTRQRISNKMLLFQSEYTTCYTDNKFFSWWKKNILLSAINYSIPTLPHKSYKCFLLGRFFSWGCIPQLYGRYQVLLFLRESIHPHDSCCLKREALSTLPAPPWPNPTHHIYQSIKYLMTEYAKGQKWQLSPIFYCCSSPPSRQKTVWNNKTWNILAPCSSLDHQIYGSLEYSWGGSSHLDWHL